MIQKALRSLRRYLTARDLDMEVPGGLVVEPLDVTQSQVAPARGARAHVEYFDVDHLTAQRLKLSRLAAPLPPAVRSVAITSLIMFGVLCSAGVLFVVGGGVAVVLMPIMMGRAGVGTAMITLFVVCVTFVISGILLLAARSAARIIRRERRGVRTLYLFSLFGLIVTVVAYGMAYWLKASFFGDDIPDNSNASVTMAVMAVMVVPLIFIAWFARAAFVLSRFARDIQKNEQMPL